MKPFILILTALLFLTACGKKGSKTHSDHEGHDHADHEGHDHADHEGHDHSDHEGHDHADHEGHDHSDHEGHDHSDHEGHDHSGHEGHDHSDHEENSKISPQALKNMGIKIQTVSIGEYTVFNPVPAIITEDPLNEQPIFAPFSGRVKSIDLVIGEYKKSGEILITLYRDPIKRPALTMVEHIITPASEEFHTGVSSLRQNLKGKEVLDSELARLAKFQKDAGSLSLVPQKDLIDLRYEIAKVTRAIESGRRKLELHGLNAKEIAQLEKGKFNIDLYRIWKNSLKSNNIWNKEADTILNLLSDKLKKNRWTVATIGELVAEDLFSEELTNWLKSDPKTGHSFLEIISLYQQGHSIDDLKALYAAGAFNAIIQINAPIKESGWDVEKLLVKVGQKVKAGQKILILANQSKMQLVASPQSSEIVDMTQAAKKNMSIAAAPLTAQASPTLSKLKISQIRGVDGDQEQVIIPVTNSILSQSVQDKNNFRIWSLRSGLKYILKVPTNVMKDVIVLPLAAVVSHGPDKVVFVKKGGEYIRRKIVVLHQDSEVVVIGKDSELKAGESTIISGAFALQIALVSGTPQAVDPHAGHNH